MYILFTINVDCLCDKKTRNAERPLDAIIFFLPSFFLSACLLKAYSSNFGWYDSPRYFYTVNIEFKLISL